MCRRSGGEFVRRSGGSDLSNNRFELYHPEKPVPASSKTRHKLRIGLNRPVRIGGASSPVRLLLSSRAASTLQELLPVIHPARPQADVRARASPADGKVPEFGSCAAGVANTALRISRAAMNNVENKEETTS